MARLTPRELRIRRHRRLRRRLAGRPERPRLCVFRSNLHIYAQIVDDVIGHTLVAASTTEHDLRNRLSQQPPEGEQRKIAQAKVIGKLVAERALEAGIKQVVFDRGGFTYHGRVKALAEAAREAGLEF